jgi:ribonuclease BN (tRNA processing enzyme)
MPFTLTVLGSGTSVPMATRMAPAYLLRAAGEDRTTSLLLDCGSGCTTSLVRAGVRPETLDGIVLSHLHPDHTGDLLSLLFALSNPVGAPRRTELPLWGPIGTADFYRTLQRVYGNWVRPRGGEVRVGELDDRRTLTLWPLSLEAHAVEHAGASLAYRIRAQGAGGTLCFSGDSGPCDGLLTAASGAAIFLCECAALEDEKAEMHMKASEVGRLAAAAGCREVVLTHLYERVALSDPVSRVRQLFSGPVRVAEDGMVLEIR